MSETKTLKEYLQQPLVWLVILVRLVFAIFILINPFWGLILTFAADFFDSYLLIDYLGMRRRTYIYFDKYLDWMTYPFMLVVGMKFGVAAILSILLLFRLIGQVLFSVTRKEVFFILFPNFFEPAFFLLVALRGINVNLYGNTFIEIVIFLFVFQILREVFLHYLTRAYLLKYGYPRILKKVGYYRKIDWS